MDENMRKAYEYLTDCNTQVRQEQEDIHTAWETTNYQSP